MAPRSPLPWLFRGEAAGLPRPEDEGVGDERVSRHVARPGFGQRAGQREQHGACGQRHHGIRIPHRKPAGIDDQHIGREQRFHVFEPEQPRIAAREQAGSGGVQGEDGVVDFCAQGWDAGLASRLLSVDQGYARGLGLHAAHGNAGDDQRVRRPQCRRQARWFEYGQCALGLVQPADQEQAADFEIPRMRGIDMIAMRFERSPRGVERLLRPAQVTRGQRDFGFGDDAAGTGKGFSRSEGFSLR